MLQQHLIQLYILSPLGRLQDLQHLQHRISCFLRVMMRYVMDVMPETELCRTANIWPQPEPSWPATTSCH